MKTCQTKDNLDQVGGVGGQRYVLSRADLFDISTKGPPLLQCHFCRCMEGREWCVLPAFTSLYQEGQTCPSIMSTINTDTRRGRKVSFPLRSGKHKHGRAEKPPSLLIYYLHRHLEGQCCCRRTEGQKTCPRPKVAALD